MTTSPLSSYFRSYRWGASVNASTVLTRLILEISSSLDITKPLTLTKPSGLGAIFIFQIFFMVSLEILSSRFCSLWYFSLVWDHYKVLLHVCNWKRIVFSENDSVVENFKNSSWGNRTITDMRKIRTSAKELLSFLRDSACKWSNSVGYPARLDIRPLRNHPK